MVIQKKVHVNVPRIMQTGGANQNSRADQLGNWRIADVSMSYLTDEAVINGTLNAAIGMVNMTPDDIRLEFPTSQKVRVEIYDDAGNLVYESDPPAGAATTQVIAATSGENWLEPVFLDSNIFASGATYTMRGFITASNLPGSASLELTIA